jgi:hypothetical protein
MRVPSGANTTTMAAPFRASRPPTYTRPLASTQTPEVFISAPSKRCACISKRPDLDSDVLLHADDDDDEDDEDDDDEDEDDDEEDEDDDADEARE